ncbi:unnamed protein product, partial [Polarella glacialis]
VDPANGSSAIRAIDSTELERLGRELGHERTERQRMVQDLKDVAVDTERLREVLQATNDHLLRVSGAEAAQRDAPGSQASSARSSAQRLGAIANRRSTGQRGRPGSRFASQGIERIEEEEEESQQTGFQQQQQQQQQQLQQAGASVPKGWGAVPSAVPEEAVAGGVDEGGSFISRMMGRASM